MNRTGSMGSWVGPAVTRMRLPARSRPADSAANVASPTNSRAPRVITTCTVAPDCVNRRRRYAALYAATPPVTPRSTRRPASGERPEVLLDADTLGPLEDDLAFGDLLQGDRQRLVLQPARLDERRHELSAALAELAVVGVDLAGPFRGEDDERVLRVH